MIVAQGDKGSGAVLLAVSPSRADTAVSACGTLSAAGNYYLTENLTATGTCIVVDSEGVSLDMKGHTITGNGTGDGITDGGSHFESMAIANGKIRNFNDGIGLHKSCCVVIRNVDSSNNAETGILIGECCGTLDSVKANNNGTVGIVASDCCYTLNNVQVKHNGGGGGIVANGCCTTVSNSTITGNAGPGVVQDGCCSFLVSSKVQRNGGDGVDMNDCCKRTTDNQITSSQSVGNHGAGANVGCPGAITGLVAKNNTGAPLTTSGGTCTQLNNTL